MLKFNNNLNVLIKASSANKKSLALFVASFKKFNNFYFKNKIKMNRLKVKKYLISILKSPHVNKIAQEQFDKQKFCVTIKIKNANNKNFFFLIKMLTIIFSDITVKVKFTIYPYDMKRTKRKVFFLKTVDPDKIPLTTGTNKKQNTVSYFNLLDMYGEVCNKGSNPLKCLYVFSINVFTVFRFSSDQPFWALFWT